jgi:hypothetical protein
MQDDAFAAYDAQRARSAAIWVMDTAWTEADLPQRRWVAPKYALRGAVTVIAGPPSAMKSSLMLAWGCAVALGRQHGHFRPREPGKAVLYNVEDGADEQRRRLSAALRQFDASPADIAGKVVCIGPLEAGMLFVDGDGEILPTPLMARLREIITERRPDLFVADPFAELHGLDENSNTGVRAVIAQFRALAVEFDMAVILVHHTRKGTLEPGDPEILRGGSAIVGGGRSIFTLLPMGEKDAEVLGSPTDRKSRSRFVRLDDAKLNYADIAEAVWYEKTLYTLGNDEIVPAAVPWKAPDIWQAISTTVANKVLDEIDAGLDGGHRYSTAPSATGRAAWRVVQRHIPSFTEPQARAVIKTWLKNGVLVREDYQDAAEGKKRQGVRVDNAKRPG